MLLLVPGLNELPLMGETFPEVDRLTIPKWKPPKPESYTFPPAPWTVGCDRSTLEKIANIENFQMGVESDDTMDLMDGYIGVSGEDHVGGIEMSREDVLEVLHACHSREMRINALKYGPPDPHSLKHCRLWRGVFRGANEASKYIVENMGQYCRGRSTATKFPDFGPGVFFGVAHAGHQSDEFVGPIRCCYDTKVPIETEYYRHGNIMQWEDLVLPGEVIYSDVAVGNDEGFIFTSALAQAYEDMWLAGFDIVIKWDLSRDFFAPDEFVSVRKQLLHNDEIIVAIGPNILGRRTAREAFAYYRKRQVRANEERNTALYLGSLSFTPLAWGGLSLELAPSGPEKPKKAKSTLPPTRSRAVSAVVNVTLGQKVYGLAMDPTPIPVPPVILPKSGRMVALTNYRPTRERWLPHFCQAAWAEGHAPKYDRELGWYLVKTRKPPPRFDKQAYLDYINPALAGAEVGACDYDDGVESD